MWTIREWKIEDVEQLCVIWNEIIHSGAYYMGEQEMDCKAMKEMCSVQTKTCCIVNEKGVIGGFYILHPNHIGRGQHIANATYAVKSEFRGCGLGRALVKDSIYNAKAHHFKGFQFNAVVSTNEAAVKLYEQLGFKIVGTAPGAFRLKDNEYVDLYIMFMNLEATQ